MSRIALLARALPRQLTRSAHSSPTTKAAAAPASSASAAARPATPRRVAVPASATRISKAPFKPAAPTRPAATPGVAAESEFDFDFPLPEAEPIEDYAHLAPAKPTASAGPSSSSKGTIGSSSSSNPLGAGIAPSPPLTAFPNDSYRPLPTTAAGEGVGLGDTTNDWSTSFAGLSQRPFDREVADALLRPLQKDDVEIKPDGLLYLPEIKYRRTLNAAFGPGGWGLAPRGETHVGPRIVSREWGLVCLGRLVSIARGEQEYFDPSGVPTATEACKSNALMRCCKDLGIASELWDPSFIRDFKAKHCVEVWVEHSTQKKKRKLWRKKDAAKFDYPYKEVGPV